MRQLIESNNKYLEAIFPYLGGEELNSSPNLNYHRFVIDFGDLPLDLAQRQWPKLLEILRIKVKPFRDGLKRKCYRENWWLHGERQPELYRQM